MSGITAEELSRFFGATQGVRFFRATSGKPISEGLGKSTWIKLVKKSGLELGLGGQDEARKPQLRTEAV